MPRGSMRTLRKSISVSSAHFGVDPLLTSTDSPGKSVKDTVDWVGFVRTSELMGPFFRAEATAQKLSHRSKRTAPAQKLGNFLADRNGGGFWWCINDCYRSHGFASAIQVHCCMRRLDASSGKEDGSAMAHWTCESQGYCIAFGVTREAIEVWT